LHIISTVHYKITIFQWIEQALKHIPSMTVAEAETYFKTYAILLSRFEMEGTEIGDEEVKIDNPATIETVDVR